MKKISFGLGIKSTTSCHRRFLLLDGWKIFGVESSMSDFKSSETDMVNRFARDVLALEVLSFATDTVTCNSEKIFLKVLRALIMIFNEIILHEIIC